MKTTRQLSKKTDSSARPLLYRLKVTLLDSKPPIWRRLLVRGDTTLGRLHRIVQEAMGWYDGHLHTFTVRGNTYSMPDPEWMEPMRDERKATLVGLRLTPRSRFRYEYDMGDGWEHEILVEAVTEAESSRPRRAVCLDGKRACPPEDVGGTGGYEYFLEAIRDPKHKEHKDMLEWIGREFDPEAFSVAETDEALKGL
ncbi:MAG TPA: plasmid pRiA4b ORF-3 family protein [bacterium]|nr:plasmid pRiA4b ORF-3 family protein [bacterium]